MPAPIPLFQPYHTINQVYGGNAYTIENAGTAVALPQSTKVIEGFGFSVRAELLQPMNSQRAYAVGIKDDEVRPYRFRSEFIVANPNDMEATEATVLQALRTATYIQRNGWFLTVELIKANRPVMTSYTTFTLEFEVWPRFALWTNARVQTEAAYSTTSKRDFVVFDGYLGMSVPSGFALAWITPETLTNAFIGTFYSLPLVATGGSGGFVFSKQSGDANINILPTGYLEWLFPDKESTTVTVRVTDSTSNFLDRTFTIAVDGNWYVDGDFILMDGNYVLTY